MSQKVSKKLTFDPKKNYQWEPDDRFTLTGAEFEFLYNLANQQYNGAIIPPRMAHQQFTILHGLFVTAVEAGIAVPAEKIQPAEETGDFIIK